jgi:hypothetical protein
MPRSKNRMMLEKGSITVNSTTWPEARRKIRGTGGTGSIFQAHDCSVGSGEDTNVQSVQVLTGIVIEVLDSTEVP